MYKSLDPSDITVFTGLGESFFQYTALHGSRAFVTELVNYLPEKAFAIYETAKREDYKALAEIIDSLDVLEAFKGRVASRQNVSTTLSAYSPTGGIPVYQSVVKEAMKMIGFPVGKVMRPMYNLSPQEIDELKEIMKGLGAI
jgi:dihydrodipicolinate synthase/N-acetylneuraminate lyase